MSKLNQIQSALLEIEGGKFQKLGDAYLHAKGYRQINSIGSLIGSDKVRKGTPDTFVPLPNGKFVFFEHTTEAQETLFSKLKRDLDKCFDPAQTGVDVGRIQEIVFCHVGTLSPGQLSTLQEDCAKREINFNQFGISAISFDLSLDYPGLARDFLNVEVDTGQIVSIDDFIKKYDKSPLVAPLETKFYFRDDDMKSAMDALAEKDLVIITGNSGIGKSRFAIEVTIKFCEENPNYEPWAIYNRGVADLFEDLKVYFSKPGSYLIFVDDANRLSAGFQYILTLLTDVTEDKHFKLVVTVRDYAIDKIRKQAEDCSSAVEIPLRRFSDDEIRKLLQEEFRITHPLLLEQIAYISRGNPRLAVMAAKVAKGEIPEGISDLPSIYDKYYGRVVEQLGLASDPDLLKAAGIVSFFRMVDFSHHQLLTAIHDAFHIDPMALKMACGKLQTFEIFDMYENEIVKFVDQVLSTYLFYQTFFKQDILDFSSLLSHFFPAYKERMIDAINPVLNSFDFGAVVKAMGPHVSSQLTALSEAGDERRLLEFMKVFWFVQPTDILSHIQDKISNLEDNSVDTPTFPEKSQTYAPTDSLLGVLEAFASSEFDIFTIAVSLILDYAKKRQDELSNVLHTFVEPFGFNRFSADQNYERQNYVVDRLLDRCENANNKPFSLLFLQVARVYLHTEFNSTEFREGNQFILYTIKLFPLESLFQLRKKLFEGIFMCHNQVALREASLKVVEDYIRSAAPRADAEILKQDSEELIPFIQRHFDPSNFTQCDLALEYLDLLVQNAILIDDGLRKKFTSDAQTAVELVRENIDEMAKSNLSLDEYKKKKKQKIGIHFQSYSFEGYVEFFNLYSKAVSDAKGTHKQWQLITGIDDLFDELADHDPELFIKVTKHYLSTGDSLRLNHYVVINHLIKVCGLDEAFRILREPEPQLNRWLFGYYHFLTDEQISKEDIESICTLYSESSREDMPHYWDYLLKCRGKDPQILVRIGRILAHRISTDISFTRELEMLFNSHTEANKSICTLFSTDIPLLKELYFHHLAAREYPDFDGATFAQLLKIDPHFLIEYVDWLYNSKEWISRHDDSRDYGFIWMADNYLETMTSFMEHLFEKHKDKRLFLPGYETVFFTTREGNKAISKIAERQDGFMRNFIVKHHDNKLILRFLFEIIAEFPATRRRDLIGFLLSQNNKFELFKSVPLEPTPGVEYGSRVPYLQARIDYLSSLLPLLNAVAFLKHRQFVEHRIEFLRKQIEEEKKRDFMEP